MTRTSSGLTLRSACSLFLFAASLGCASLAQAQAADPLLFPKDQFTLETKTISTQDGDKKVEFRSYKHILYVAKPVDREYQSLDVQVPVSINGKAIDASHAPILFAVTIGGYMSANNVNPRVMRGPMGPGAMMGGPGGPGGPGAPGGPEGMMRGPGGPEAQGGQPHVGRDNMGAPAAPAGSGGPGGAPGVFLGAQGTMNGHVNIPEQALAYGYVIVTPGARGRDNKAADGSFYGKAPAAVVDLKAAVRFIRHNTGVLPGNPDQIISQGCSAGGAISALVGATGNDPQYEPYLKEIGAAEGKDNIFASGCGSPVTDLDHADGSYEWAFGASKTRNGELADQSVSAELKQIYTSYQESLNLTGRNGFGKVTAANMDAYLVKEYFAPAAKQFLLGLSEEKRKEYLEKNPWLHWDGKEAKFSYLEMAAQHISRIKQPPAFDSFKMTSPENNEFGDKTTDSKHFTLYSLRKGAGDAKATIDPELQKLVNMMNPMYYTGIKNPGVAQHWWIRHGGIETDSAPTNTVNLALSLEKMGRDVNAAVYWDAGHCQDLDPAGFITWIGKITGYQAK